MQPQAAKPWYRSKTVLFNLLCAVLAAAELQLGVLKDALPPALYSSVLFAVTLVNVVLRFASTQALARPLAQPPAKDQP